MSLYSAITRKCCLWSSAVSEIETFTEFASSESIQVESFWFWRRWWLHLIGLPCLT